MIISHKHKFVFTRMTKTGSSSAQAMLVRSGILGGIDVYTGYRDSVSSTVSHGDQTPIFSLDRIMDISPHTTCRIRKHLNHFQDTGLVANGMPLIGHVTPTEMYRLGLLTEQMINDYTFVTIARNPVRRYLSAWFFDQHLSKTQPTSAKLEKDINSNYMPWSLLNRTLEDYATFKGELIPNVLYLRTESLHRDISLFLRSNIENVQFKAGLTKGWAKGFYQDERIKDLMQKEIDFYNKIGV